MTNREFIDSFRELIGHSISLWTPVTIEGQQVATVLARFCDRLEAADAIITEMRRRGERLRAEAVAWTDDPRHTCSDVGQHAWCEGVIETVGYILDQIPVEMPRD